VVPVSDVPAEGRMGAKWSTKRSPPMSRVVKQWHAVQLAIDDVVEVYYRRPRWTTSGKGAGWASGSA
jgi:hypothetical protein